MARLTPESHREGTATCQFPSAGRRPLTSSWLGSSCGSTASTVELYVDGDHAERRRNANCMTTRTVDVLDGTRHGLRGARHADFTSEAASSCTVWAPPPHHSMVTYDTSIEVMWSGIGASAPTSRSTTICCCVTAT